MMNQYQYKDEAIAERGSTIHNVLYMPLDVRLVLLRSIIIWIVQKYDYCVLSISTFNNSVLRTK